MRQRVRQTTLFNKQTRNQSGAGNELDQDFLYEEDNLRRYGSNSETYNVKPHDISGSSVLRPWTLLHFHFFFLFLFALALSTQAIPSEIGNNHVLDPQQLENME